MRYPRPAWSLLYLILLLSFALGCQALHPDRPIVVLVADAETKKPIPAAEVVLCHYLTPDSVVPGTSSAITQGNGIARMRIGAAGKDGIQLQASAQGYLPSDLDVTASAVEQIEPAHLFEAIERRPVQFVVELYCEPSFTVELLIPIDYRGLVKAEVQIQEDAPARPAGQRVLRFEVSSSGTVQVKGPSLLRRIEGSDFRASYLDGRRLGSEMDAGTVGFHWVKTEGKALYFVVGTQTEYEALRRTLVPEAKVESVRSGGGGRSGGRGGRHRRSSQTPSD